MLPPFAFKETMKSETLALGMQAQGFYLALKLWTVKLGSEQSLSRDRPHQEAPGSWGHWLRPVQSGFWQLAQEILDFRERGVDMYKIAVLFPHLRRSLLCRWF